MRTQYGRPRLHALDADPRRWSLEQYIEVARGLSVIGGAAANAAMLAKDFRNLIHPGRAERVGQRATRGTAAQGVAALTLTVEDLAQGVTNGTL